MSWNKPGGGDNGNRDPWGERPGQQGPPDLDEVVKKLQAKLAAMFGGKSSGGGSNGAGDGSGDGSGGGGGGLSAAASGIGIGAIAIVALVVWGIAGVFIVDPAEEAVILRFGKYHRTESPGPHWAPYFIDEVRTVNVEAIESEEIGFRAQQGQGSKGLVPNEALMLTADENIVDMQFVVQYRVKDAADFLFRVQDPITTLRQVTESAVREIVGRSKMDFVITQGRDVVAADVQRLAQEILDRYRAGLIILSVNMQNAQPPAQVQGAFIDAIKAREDQERIINEARAFRSDIVPKSRGEADAIRERSEAYRQRVIAQAQGESSRFTQVLDEYLKAPAVTRERLYLETVETVMSNSSKVMVDVKGGNNLLYLPLDKIIDSARNSGGRRDEDVPNSVQAPARSYDSDSRSRDSRGRAR